MQKFKNEKGAATLIVVVTMLFIISTLMSMYLIVANKAQGQTERTEEIKRIYNNVDDVEDIYNNYFAGNVIKIYTPEQLLNIGKETKLEIDGKVYTFSADVAYVLMNDIEFDTDDYTDVLGEDTDWTPIGLTDYKFEGNGNKIKITKLNDTIIECNKDNLYTAWDTTKVSVIKEGENKIPVPIGFVASTIDTEKTVDEGFVIYQGTVDETSNQYVWIPVLDGDSNISLNNMIKLQAASNVNYEGRLYDFISNTSWDEKINYGIGTASYREPANLSTSYDNATNITNWTTTLYQNEFNAMVESIKTYKGFYVGRYETGGFDTEQAVVLPGKTGSTSEDNPGSINNINWYTMYSKTKTLSTETVTASMIWGCQWNQIMKVAECSQETTPAKEITMLKTGDVSTDKYYNIYDLCGNVKELTRNAYTDMRLYYGGDYQQSSNVSSCSYCEPSVADIGIGSRAVLIINK